MNSSNKSSIAFPIVICAVALALVAATLSGEAAQLRLDPSRASIVTAKHAPIQVIPDANGNALMTGEAQFISTNWSGYVLPEFITGERYVSAQATWVVPTVVFKKKSAVSSNWVGIGGFCENMRCKAKDVDQTLIQLGTAQVAESRTETDYFAWYEMLPEPSVATTLVVNPGDVITASLTCDGDCTGSQSWTLSMTNETTAMNWSQDFDYASPNLSAEWIEEAPTGRRGILPLADFGITTFDQSMTNGVSALLNLADSIVMRDPHGESSNVSNLDSTLDGFSACYGPHKALKPCSFVPLP
ncbi:G1 family glutamic endopeptidase [Candidatus Binatus sp.]|uniref:G1 family glutamic endopeptidase n=1 Tax=Candidatus Binatus sp. TaxID=2811406 RepID=UPI003CB59FCD